MTRKKALAARSGRRSLRNHGQRPTARTSGRKRTVLLSQRLVRMWRRNKRGLARAKSPMLAVTCVASCEVSIPKVLSV